uniref:Hypothetical chloroplast RF20 n=1 Tax=Tydemania expeditionis TaxID=325645 RepID=A0A0D6E1H5_TYDEX|nr:hypothetical chloroplast RF20 [Tydemania expeditionis]CEO91069.1 hypothetical chloroplast RF20 [Tydemania expeditionis]
MVLIFEILNFMVYNKRLLNNPLLIILKNIQLGVLLGFFIDAFKVGS